MVLRHGRPCETASRNLPARLPRAAPLEPEESVTELHLTRRQKEDPVIAAWARFQDWFMDNARIVLGAVGIVIAIVLIGGLWLKNRADSEAKGSGQLAEASALDRAGAYRPHS